MPEEEKNKNIPENDDDRIKIGGGKKVSALESFRRLNEKARSEEIREESRLEAARAEKERAAREEYARKLAEERIELMKLKAGVISEDDIPQPPPEAVKKYTLKDKISNFFYHNKAYVIFFTALAALVIFLVYDYVTNERPDASMIIIVRNNEFVTRAQDIQTLLEPYCEDYNGDGLVYLRVSYLPAVMDSTADTAELYYNQGEQTRLVAEFQTAESVMVITNDAVTEKLGLNENVFADLRDLYPGNEYVTEYGFMLNGTKIAEDIKFTAMPGDLYLAFRKPRGALGINEKDFAENYENALKIWNNYLNGTPVSEDIEHYSDRWSK